MKFFELLLVLVSSTMFLLMLEGTVIENVTSYTWDGIAMYVPVDRNLVQKRLDEYHESSAGQCNRPTLYLPDTPVLPDILNEDQHLLFINIGYAASLDYKDYQDSCLDTEGAVVAVTIPFLSSSASSAPQYSLALAKMYDRRRGDIVKPNIAFPYMPIDEVTLEDNFAVLRNGSDEFRFSFENYKKPCIPVTSVVRHEFNDFTQHEMQIGAAEPNFDICDRHPMDGRFCSIVKDIRCDVSRTIPNFCQLSWKSPDLTSCKTSVEILNITSGFRDFMLLNDGPINLIASEIFNGHFSIGIKYPCIE